MRVFSLSAALVACSARHFSQSPVDVRPFTITRTCFAVFLRVVTARSRAPRRGVPGHWPDTDRERSKPRARPDSPFARATRSERQPLSSIPAERFHPACIASGWETMRHISEHFPRAPGRPEDVGAHLKRIEEHVRRLSIEGHHVSPALIEAVRGGAWNPRNEDHRAQRDALAARGYWQPARLCAAACAECSKGRTPEPSGKKTTGPGTGRCSPPGWPRVSSNPPILPGTATLRSTSGARCTFRRTRKRSATRCLRSSTSCATRPSRAFVSCSGTSCSSTFTPGRTVTGALDGF